jgi:hypothetical protein
MSGPGGGAQPAGLLLLGFEGPAGWWQPRYRSVPGMGVFSRVGITPRTVVGGRPLCSAVRTIAASLGSVVPASRTAADRVLVSVVYGDCGPLFDGLLIDWQYGPDDGWVLQRLLALVRLGVVRLLTVSITQSPDHTITT